MGRVMGGGWAPPAGVTDSRQVLENPGRMRHRACHGSGSYGLDAIMFEIEGRDHAEVVDLDGAPLASISSTSMSRPLSLGQDEGLFSLGRLAGFGRHLCFEQGAFDASEGGNPWRTSWAAEACWLRDQAAAAAV